GIEPARVLDHMYEILVFPLNNPEVVPSLIPILVGLVVLEIYFGRHVYEELGWNTALGNATMLVTTALTLIHDLKLWKTPYSNESYVAYTIIIVGLIIVILNFYHIWPKEIAFGVSSALIMYTLAYLTIALTYGDIFVTEETIVAAFLFLAGTTIVFKTIQHFETSVID
ncbi:MAG: hypothetical protein SVU32_06365, partial [Candidatus Nanohaloarchaea archaeon]|nr:hypothetical protein [Candidatus Nanohaloarchaea archaeon]